VGSLAQIEKVLFLQGVEVFSYCSASQILRIASIAHERRLSAGEEVYSLNDAADSIYCVVEGRVKLENAFNETATVEQNATFGLLDILSGRLREASATAETDGLALGIDGEDFFDLLSNNVDIVKGLFRHLLDGALKPVAW
jgi:CRP-like cAMP-binding protein